MDTVITRAFCSFEERLVEVESRCETLRFPRSNALVARSDPSLLVSSLARLERCRLEPARESESARAGLQLESPDERRRSGRPSASSLTPAPRRVRSPRSPSPRSLAPRPAWRGTLLHLLYARRSTTAPTTSPACASSRLSTPPRRPASPLASPRAFRPLHGTATARTASEQGPPTDAGSTNAACSTATRRGPGGRTSGTRRSERGGSLDSASRATTTRFAAASGGGTGTAGARAAEGRGEMLLARRSKVRPSCSTSPASFAC